jgi:hypothetical protein
MTNTTIDIEPSTTALVRVDNDNPAFLMRRATDVAGVSRDIVMRTAMSIQGRKYVRVEGWQAIAVAHGCVASARDVERIEGGFRAIGEVRRMTDGVVLATAEGFVGDDETATWAKRPEYARRAMAQTRAISRACRSAFAHVVVLIDSNLSTTPAEEVPDGGFEPDKPAATVSAPPPTKPATAPARPQNAPSTPAPAEKEPEFDIKPNGEPWRDLVTPFPVGGIEKGTRLGDLPRPKLWWWCMKWQPKPYKGQISPADFHLRQVLDEVGPGLFPPEGQAQEAPSLPPDDSDVPF